MVQQDEFVETGVNTLVKLAEFIEHESDIVLHLTGSMVGNVPPTDVTSELLRHCVEDRLRERFPKLFAGDAFRHVTYTQWEAWLGLFYGKRVLLFLADDAFSGGEPASPQAGRAAPMLVAEHLALLKPLLGYFTPFADEVALVREVQASLLRYLNRGTHHHDRPCHLPYATLGELFIGRDSFLSELQQKFEAARVAGRWPNQAVCGVGGLGKTQVAVEYALKHRDEYTAVLMVNADTPESLRSGLAGLAGVLHSGLDPATPDDAKERATLDWLQQHPGWLLIVDNADTEAARNEVTRRLAQWADGHVLITARFHQWPKTVEAFDLHVLSFEDAARFLLQATDGTRRVSKDDEEQARQLAGDDLDGLCLALEQAAAYIREREISFAEYRRRWTENDKAVRTWADKAVMQYHSELTESLSVATTWLTTFRELTPAAQSLLQLFAWLAPAPIPQSLVDHPELEQQLQSACRVGPAALRRAGPPPDSTNEDGGPALEASLSHPTADHAAEADIESALAVLRRYSFLSRRPGDPTDSAGRVHRVVQLITRERLDHDRQQATLTAMLQVANANVKGDAADVRTWPTLDPLRPHLMMLIDHAERAQIDEPTSRLMGELGTLLWAKALHTQAEDLEKRALALDERHYGPVAPQVATRLNNLAATLQATNRLAEAEPLMRRALDIFRASLRDEHPNTLDVAENYDILRAAMK
ncbi:MAG: tetratricopeptide repeat protein [Planctomycetia bacterium]|nr:tetratricopeptide repeat protein [Planctomycetia bacterium]